MLSLFLICFYFFYLLNKVQSREFLSVVWLVGKFGKMEERYEALKELGSGNFGVARLVRDKKTKELVAVKYIERGKKVISPFIFYFLSLIFHIVGILFGKWSI